MNKPTEAQVKEFWGWCGFKVALGKLYWYPDKEPSPARRLPSIDLNNLFKYAMPKVYSIGLLTFERPDTGLDTYEASVCDSPASNPVKAYNEDPALALFWAIWEATHVRL